MGNMNDQPLSVNEAIVRFLEEKKHTLSPYTLRDYTIDLKRFASTYNGPLESITESTLGSFIGSIALLKQSSQARKYTALSRFLTWALERRLISQNPLVNLTPIRPTITFSSTAAAEIQELLQVIPPKLARDRLIFRLIGEMGLRTTTVLTLQVDDLDLTKKPMDMMVLSQGSVRKIATAVAPDLDQEIRHYLEKTGYRTGPLFRAQKGKNEEPLTSKSLYGAWKTYSSAAHITLSLHALRVSARQRNQANAT